MFSLAAVKESNFLLKKSRRNARQFAIPWIRMYHILALVTVAMSTVLLENLRCCAFSTRYSYRDCYRLSSFWLRRFQHSYRGEWTLIKFKESQIPKSALALSSSSEKFIDKDGAFVPSNPSMPRYNELRDVERVFCLSDLHTDHSDNMKWLRDHSLSSDLKKSDLVIVAGDVSHDEDTFYESISILLNQCRVLFVPGNHEAWLSSQRPSSNSQSKFTETSLDKLLRCSEVCRSMGVLIDPVYLSGGNHPVWILPLQSWYDGSLSFDEELCQGFEVWPWVDFARCNWNETVFPPMQSPNARIPKGLVEYFLEQNRIHVLEPWKDFLNSRPEFLAPSITVSHFAPNQQCLPDWKDLHSSTFQTEAWLDHGAATMSAKFAKVAGTQLLDAQLRSSSLPRPPAIHIFGHSHRPKDFVYQSIRYIHNPLGKPRERQLHMISPQVNFQLIWDVKQQGEISGPTILRYWEDFGGGKERLWERLSNVRPGRYQHDGGDRGKSSMI